MTCEPEIKRKRGKPKQEVTLSLAERIQRHEEKTGRKGYFYRLTADEKIKMDAYLKTLRS